jgi:hypothetical protein
MTLPAVGWENGPFCLAPTVNVTLRSDNGLFSVSAETFGSFLDRIS